MKCSKCIYFEDQYKVCKLEDHKTNKDSGCHKGVTQIDWQRKVIREEYLKG